MANYVPGKKYGLILPKAAAAKQPPAENRLRKKPSIFNQSDSESDKSGDEDWVKKSLKNTASKGSNLKRQTKIVMSQALEEDPTVFQYDEVYEKMEQKKEEENEKKKEVDRKPKYIKQLLKSAELRNKENERRIERQVQKEREAEGEMYADKESFVTGAYRAKMEEMAKEQEEEERKARIEAALDVTRQRDLSGFYRHLYRQTHGEEKSELDDKIRKEEEDRIKKEVEDQIKKEKEERIKEEEESSEEKAARVREQMKKIKVEDGEDNDEDGQQEQSLNIKKINTKKAFRKKVADADDESGGSSSSGSSSEDSDTEHQQIKQEKLSQEEKLELRKKELREQKERREARKRKIEQDQESSDEETEKTGDNAVDKKSKSSLETDNGDKDVSMVGQEDTESEKKPKVDIWKKRTVGDVFEAAVARYWQRVAERGRRG